MSFTEKLNKKLDGSVYVIEEEITLIDGVYQGLLKHGNINNTTIRVFAESKLSGEEITQFIVSIPSDTPWRTHLKVFSDVEKLYVTYETTGDTVDANDINEANKAIEANTNEFENYKIAGRIDGGTF